MTQRGSSRIDSQLGRRLEDATRRRMAMLQLTLPELAADLGHRVATLRAWFRATSRFHFEDIDQLDDFFARHGLPGLMDDLRQYGGAHNWHIAEEAYGSASFGEAPLGDLHDLAQGLQQSGRSPPDFLQQLGLLGHCHILAVDGGAVRPVHLGAAIPINPNQNVLGRDLRDLADRDFGLMLHDQLLRIAQLQAPRVHRIRSLRGPQVEYRRLAVPVGRHFLVTIPYDLNISPSFSLQ